MNIIKRDETRLVIIKDKRILDISDIKIYTSIQDNGKTLKIFMEDTEK